MVPSASRQRRSPSGKLAQVLVLMELFLLIASILIYRLHTSFVVLSRFPSGETAMS
ncbi:hypothetical protein [Bradyrhizobium sp. USDA 4353]